MKRSCWVFLTGKLRADEMFLSHTAGEQITCGIVRSDYSYTAGTICMCIYQTKDFIIISSQDFIWASTCHLSERPGSSRMALNRARRPWRLLCSSHHQQRVRCVCCLAPLCTWMGTVCRAGCCCVMITRGRPLLCPSCVVRSGSPLWQAKNTSLSRGCHWLLSRSLSQDLVRSLSRRASRRQQQGGPYAA